VCICVLRDCEGVKAFFVRPVRPGRLILPLALDDSLPLSVSRNAFVLFVNGETA